VDLAVAGGEALAAQGGGPGARVDVLVTTESESRPGRTYVALENAELLDVRPGEGSAGGGGSEAGEAGASAGGTMATLRVTLRQAVYLTAAQNFAREIRLLARAPGDRRHGRGASVEAGEL
jgi:pilus assembly protein CpaB